MTGRHNQLFQISHDAWVALSPPEVAATIKGMKECDIYRLPYPRVDLRLPLSAGAQITHDNPYDDATLSKFVRRGHLIRAPVPDNPHRHVLNLGPDTWLDIRDLSLDDTNYRVVIHVGRGNPDYKPGEWNGLTRSLITTERERDGFCWGLIVLLNTRNAVKATRRRKSVGLGIGRKPGVYEYTTTISLPRIIEETDPDNPGVEGGTKRPHLRRGHVRNQRFGPAREFVRPVWIEPIFVNADPEWVDKRSAYNVSL